jgi:acyl-CoA thioesterase FadM
VHTEVEGVRIGWPRVRAACDYLHPVRFEDVLDITLRLVRLGNRSLAWSCLFECGGETVARAELVTVCCRIAAGAAPVAIDIPASLARRLGGLLEEGSSDGE